MEKEIWKDAIEYENLYEVSNKGRVRSKLTGHIKTINSKASNVCIVSLCKNKKYTSKGVARLVWESFNGKLENRFYIVNKDGNILNCELDNLEIHDRTNRELLVNAPLGEQRNDSKLDNNKVTIIKMAAYIQNRCPLKLMLVGKLAKAFGVHRGTVDIIHRNKRWVHITLSEKDIRYCDNILANYNYNDRISILNALLKYKK